MKPKSKGSSPDPGKAFLRRRDVKTFFLPLALISFAAVLLRIIMSVQVVATDPFAYSPPEVTDMATYHALSRGILNGVFAGNRDSFSSS